MPSLSKLFITVLVLVIAILGFLRVGGWFVLEEAEYIVEQPVEQPLPEQLPIEQPPDKEPVLLSENTLLNVPFTFQASLGDWSNIIFQQGCEEASIFMAMLWVEGKTTNPTGAAEAIKALSYFEARTYGEFRDTSAEDSIRLIRDYFHYENFEVRHDIGAEDIRHELAKGNLVIVPVNGQKMRNPFYTPPGPIQHMTVIRGYDASAQEFITNDPGTKRGEGFRYKEEILEAALQDYVTGYKEPIHEVRKAMIVVSRG
jgi:hypothetical protein